MGCLAEVYIVFDGSEIESVFVVCEKGCANECEFGLDYIEMLQRVQAEFYLKEEENFEQLKRHN